MSLPPTLEPRLDMLASVRTHCDTLPIIAEIKASTPRHGDLLRGRSVEALVGAYEEAGARALSVVTGAWFGGSLALLERAARQTRLPILRKDFIANRAALRQSKDCGANAVLLTARLHSRAALRELAQAALALALTPFVEVDAAQQLDALELPAQAVVAINNRDIASKELHGAGVERSLLLLPKARATGAGLCVSASAIETACDARRLIAHGFDALLVGTALLRATDVAHALRALATRVEPPS